MAFEAFKDTLAAIAEEWNAAERDIKLGEQVNRKVVFPAIKELRYAGRRLADTLVVIANGGTEEEIHDLLVDARFNCHCARHDVIDAATLKMAIDLDLMLEKLGHESVLFAYAKFPQLYKSIQDAQALIASAREKREKRQEIYAEIEATKFGELVQMFDEVKASEPLMKRIAARTKSQRYFAYFLAGAAIVISFILWYFPRAP